MSYVGQVVFSEDEVEPIVATAPAELVGPPASAAGPAPWMVGPPVSAAGSAPSSPSKAWALLPLALAAWMVWG